MMGIGSVLKYQFMAPGERARSWHLINFTLVSVENVPVVLAVLTKDIRVSGPAGLAVGASESGHNRPRALQTKIGTALRPQAQDRFDSPSTFPAA
jgi:hypothetical protein